MRYVNRFLDICRDADEPFCRLGERIDIGEFIGGMDLSAVNAEGIYASRAREGDVSRVGRALSLCRLKDGNSALKLYLHAFDEEETLIPLNKSVSDMWSLEKDK